jgi:hypothetical protein
VGSCIVPGREGRVKTMTGECGNCLRALGLEEEMMAGGHPIKWPAAAAAGT